MHIPTHMPVGRYQCFRANCCLHLQGLGISHAKKYGSDKGKGGYGKRVQAIKLAQLTQKCTWLEMM